MRVTGNTQIQKIRESTEFKIIPYLESSDGRGYYCSNEEYPDVKSIYDAYLGDNFETQYLQTKASYNAMKSGVFEENLFMKIIGSIYFRLGFPVLLLVFLRAIRKFKAREKCGKCGSRRIEEASRAAIEQSYKHEKKDGKRDQRYKNNPLLTTFRLTMTCKDCSNMWTKLLTKKATKKDFIYQAANSVSSVMEEEADFDQKEQEIISASSGPGNLEERASSISKSQNAGRSREIVVNEKMRVSDLKRQFQDVYNIMIRSYQGRRIAEDDANLTSLGFHNSGDTNVKFHGRTKVGNVEKIFKEKTGIKIQIEDQNGDLADNNLSLSEVG